jgi:hypothetical protein
MEFYETEADGIHVLLCFKILVFFIPWDSMEFHQLTEFHGIRFRQGRWRGLKSYVPHLARRGDYRRLLIGGLDEK